MPNGPFQKSAAHNMAAYLMRANKLRKARKRKRKTDVTAFKLNTEVTVHHFSWILFIRSKSLDLFYIEGKGYYHRMWQPGGRDHWELSGKQFITLNLSWCPSRVQHPPRITPCLLLSLLRKFFTLPFCLLPKFEKKHRDPPISLVLSQESRKGIMASTAVVLLLNIEVGTLSPNCISKDPSL